MRKEKKRKKTIIIILQQPRFHVEIRRTWRRRVSSGNAYSTLYNITPAYDRSSRTSWRNRTDVQTTALSVEILATLIIKIIVIWSKRWSINDSKSRCLVEKKQPIWFWLFDPHNGYCLGFPIICFINAGCCFSIDVKSTACNKIFVWLVFDCDIYMLLHFNRFQ